MTYEPKLVKWMGYDLTQYIPVHKDYCITCSGFGNDNNFKFCAECMIKPQQLLG